MMVDLIKCVRMIVDSIKCVSMMVDSNKVESHILVDYIKVDSVNVYQHGCGLSQKSKWIYTAW